ncbi:hypothetical protein [Ottowia sp. VDI28]|uniref:hypothetical protein n=1 Tax=Ottowia sp. VDI28 TaxID=3133968 RepID=UPI003C2CCB19
MSAARPPEGARSGAGGEDKPVSGVDSQSPSSADELTTLRDARLTRALEHAPDAHLRPDPAARAAVLAAARKAVGPVEPVTPAPGGWRAWLGLNRGGRHRMPWNAAFATVLVAGFVTLLWRGEPVPEARMDSMESGPATQADVRAEPPAPAASTASNIAESPSHTAEVVKPPAEELPEARPPAPAPTQSAKPAPALKKPATSPPAPVPAIERAPEPAQGAAPSSKAVERAPQAMADRAEEAEDARMAQSAQRESSSARRERHAESERARLAQPPGAGAAASALPPPTPAAAPQVMAPRAQAAPSPLAKENSSRPAPSALPAGWTHLRRLPDGMAMDRTQLGPLTRALAALRADGTLPKGGVLQRVELLRDGLPLGVLTLHAEGWRYQPADPAEAERAGPLNASEAARLSGELARLAPGR